MVPQMVLGQGHPPNRAPHLRVTGPVASEILAQQDLVAEPLHT